MNRSAAHAIKDEVRSVVVFIGVIWAVFALDQVFHWELPKQYALVPRTFGGTVGILTMPFLHGGIGHILSNTLPLFILLILLAGSNVKSWEIVAGLIVVNGVLLWLFGSAARHIGASGLVFGLVGYLIGSGFFERRLIPMAMAVIVGLMFGGMTLNGLTWQEGVSWGGHFFGLLAGISLAYIMARDSALAHDTTVAAKRG